MITVTRIPWRRLLGWSLFAAFLGGLGWALYEFLPPRPRWTADGSHVPWRELPDGSGVALSKKRRVTGVVREIAVRDLDSGQLRWSFGQGEELIWEVSADGQWAVADSAGKEIFCANLITGATWRVVVPKTSYTPTFSPDGAYVLVESNDASATILTTTTGQIQEEPTRGFYTPFAVTPTHVATYAASTGPRGEHIEHLRLWDRQSYKVQEHSVNGELLTVSPDGKLLVTRGVGNEDAISFWTLPGFVQRMVLHNFPWPARAEGSGTIYCTPDASHLVFHRPNSDDGRTSVYFWRVDGLALTGRVMNAPWSRDSFCVGFQIIRKPQQLITPDGRLWIQNSFATVSACDIAAGHRIWERPSPGNLIGLAAQGSRLVLFSTEKEHIEILEAATGAVVLQLQTDQQPDLDLLPHLTRNGRYLACLQAVTPKEPGPVEKLLRDWLPASWFSKSVHRVSIADTEEGTVLFQRNMACEDVWVSEDGRSLITRSEPDADGERTISCWDVPFNRYWLAIVGVPGGIGASLLAWQWLRRKRGATA